MVGNIGCPRATESLGARYSGAASGDVLRNQAAKTLTTLRRLGQLELVRAVVVVLGKAEVTDLRAPAYVPQTRDVAGPTYEQRNRFLGMLTRLLINALSAGGQ